METLIRVLKKYEVRNWCGVERERVGSGEERSPGIRSSEGGRQRTHSGNDVKMPSSAQ